MGSGAVRELGDRRRAWAQAVTRNVVGTKPAPYRRPSRRLQAGQDDGGGRSNDLHCLNHAYNRGEKSAGHGATAGVGGLKAEGAGGLRPYDY